MKFGDRLHGTVSRLDDKGRGVFDFVMPNPVDGTREVVIPFSAPSDEFDATFVKRDQGHWVAKLEKIEQPSPSRVEAPCPHAGVCGGCLWQHMTYDAQLTMKRDMINAAFKNAGHEVQIASVIPCPTALHYRNRMDYVIGWKGELGLKEYGSWSRYIDLTTCLLLDEDTPKILQTCRELMNELRLEPWDAKKNTGQMRYVVIRLGRNTNERLVMLVVKDCSRLTTDEKKEITKRLAPFATTLLLGENPEITDLSYVKSYELLAGKEYLEEEVNGLRYIIHPNSFFQTNTAMASVLQNTVMDFVGAHGYAPSTVDTTDGAHNHAPLQEKRILDLYCGLGFFGIAAAKNGATVYGHELDAAAIELAKVNAEKNDVGDRCTFGAGPVEALDWSDKNPDVVIVDPPRAGLHPKALATLLEKQPPTLVYVSCNYHSFVKELQQLKTVYDIVEVKALDLFPQTPHVEVVTKLVLKSKLST